MDTATKYQTVAQFAEATGLPKGWIEREARAGRLPCVRAGRRRFIIVSEAERALIELAESKPGEGRPS